MDVCLAELRQCQTISPRPNFLILLGDRYGWQPPPARVEAADFDALSQHLSAHEKATIAASYRRDDNHLGGAWVLDRQDEPADQRMARERELLAIWRAVAGHLPEARQAVFFLSATHQEIVAGALAAPQANSHVVACFRDIANLPPTEVGGAFQDLGDDGAPDPYARRQLDVVRRQLRAVLDPGRQFAYAATWAGDDISRDHLDGFARDVEAALRATIAAQIAPRAAPEPEEAPGGFVAGFEAQTEALCDALAGGGRQALLVGPGGAGKSVLAELVAAQARAAGKSVVLAYRLGRTPELTHLDGLFERLRADLAAAGALAAAGGAVTLDGLASDMAPGRSVLIVLDGLDELPPREQRALADRVFVRAPDRISVLATVRPGALADALRASCEGLDAHEVTELSRAVAETIVTTQLRGYGRQLQPLQLAAVLDGFAHVRSPLYLRLCVEVARAWRSFDATGPLPQTLEEAILWALEQIARHAHLEPEFTTTALNLLALSRFGLNHAELLEACYLDPSTRDAFLSNAQHDWRGYALPLILWSRLRDALGGLLQVRVVGGVAVSTFGHREFGAVLGRRLGDAGVRRVHGLLAQAFAQRAQSGDPLRSLSPFLGRALGERAAHLALAGDGAALADLLGDVAYVHGLCRFGYLSDLGDWIWGDGLQAPDAAHETLRFLRRSLRALRRETADWGAGDILLQLALEEPEGSAARDAAQAILMQLGRSGLRLCSLDGTPARLTADDVVVIEAHARLEGLAARPDGTLLTWGSRLEDGRHELRVWTRDGGEVATFGDEDRIDGALVLGDGGVWSWGQRRGRAELSVWSPDGHRLHAFATDAVRTVAATDHGFIATLDARGHLAIRALSGDPSVTADFIDPSNAHIGATTPGDIYAYGSGLTRQDLSSPKDLLVFQEGGLIVRMLGPHNGAVTDVVATADGRLVSRDDTGALWFWDMASGCTFSRPGQQGFHVLGDKVVAVGDGWLVALTTAGEVIGAVGSIAGEDPVRYQAGAAGFVLFERDGFNHLWRLDADDIGNRMFFSGKTVTVLPDGGLLGVHDSVARPAATVFHDAIGDYRRSFDRRVRVVAASEGGVFVDHEDDDISELSFLGSDGSVFAFSLHSAPVTRILELEERIVAACVGSDTDGSVSIWPMRARGGFHNFAKNEQRVSRKQFQARAQAEAVGSATDWAVECVTGAGVRARAVTHRPGWLGAPRPAIRLPGRVVTEGFGKVDALRLLPLGGAAIAWCGSSAAGVQAGLLQPDTGVVRRWGPLAAAEVVGRRLVTVQRPAAGSYEIGLVAPDGGDTETMGPFTHHACAGSVLWAAAGPTLLRVDLGDDTPSVARWDALSAIDGLFVAADGAAVVLAGGRVRRIGPLP